MTTAKIIHPYLLAGTATLLALTMLGNAQSGELAASEPEPIDEAIDPIRPFSDLDLDHDGVLSSSEAHASPRIGADWRRLDRNKDGVLDRSEIREVMDSAPTAKEALR